tara:strand:- start:446 stop:703 length:258 start_codon:yes stop_codon:yes gene_type:complete
VYISAFNVLPDVLSKAVLTLMRSRESRYIGAPEMRVVAINIPENIDSISFHSFRNLLRMRLRILKEFDEANKLIIFTMVKSLIVN